MSCCLPFGCFQLFDLRLQANDFFIFYFDLITLVLYHGEEIFELIIVDAGGIEAVHTIDEVAEDVHIVGEGIKRTVIDAAVDAH